MEGLHARVEQERQLLDLFIAMLERHAQQCRYVNLDEAALRADQHADPTWDRQTWAPIDRWEDLTSEVMDRDTELLTDLNDDWDGAVKETNKRIADVVESWLQWLQAAWTSGALGEPAHGWAQLPPDFPAA